MRAVATFATTLTFTAGQDVPFQCVKEYPNTFDDSVTDPLSSRASNYDEVMLEPTSVTLKHRVKSLKFC